MKKNLLLLSVLSLATGMLFSCKENEKESAVQLPAPIVLQDEAKSGATTVAATWTAIPNAISYSVVFDEGEPITISSTEMAWPGLEKKSEHLVKVKALSGNKSKYSDSNWSEVVVLKTIGTSKPSGEAYTITFSNIDFYKADAHIESHLGKDYFFEVTPKVLFDRDYDGEFDNFAADYVAQIKQLAEISEKTFGDMWLAFKFNGSKNNDFTISSLAPETEYIGIAFGVDINGNITTPCSYETFTTTKDPGYAESEMKFDIGVEFLKETTVKVSVTPTVNDEYYFYAAINKEQLPGNTDEDIINYYLRVFAQHLDGESFDSFAKANLTKGADSYTYSGLPDNAEYVVVAFGVTYHGEMCVATTGLTKKEFHTGEVSTNPDEKEIELSINKLTSTNIEATIIPSDKNKSYLYDFVTFDRFKGLTDEEIMDKVIADRGGYVWMTATKQNTAYRNVNDLKAGTEYILCAFYIDEVPGNEAAAKASGKLFKTIIVPPAEGGTEPEKPSLTFSISPDEVTATSIKATVTPSDASAKYLSVLVEASKYEGKSDEEIMKGVISDLGYDIYNEVKTGATTLSSSKCKPETEYLALAFGVDDSFNANSTLTKRTIETKSDGANPPSEEKTISINVKECTATKIVADFKPSDDTMKYIPMAFKASDIAKLNDSDIISKILEENEYNYYSLAQTGKYTMTRPICTPNTEYVLVAVGVDSTYSAITGLFRQEVKTKAE